MYGSFLTALAEYKRGQVHWCNRRWEDPRSDATFAARVESYRLQGTAQAALSQLQLVAGNSEVADAGREAWDLTHSIQRAEDNAALDAKADTAKTAVDRFIALAASEVQARDDAGGCHRQWPTLRLPAWLTGNPGTSSSEAPDHA